jgi:alanine dehydrogenase
MTLVLSDADVRKACDIAGMVETLDDGLRQEAQGPGAILPERVNLAYSDTFFRVMPAVLPEAGLLGLKFFWGTMAKGVRYVVAVCSLHTGEVLALVDASYLTAARTGATSGVATRWMAPERAGSVGVIGSGLEAETNLLAIAAVRPLTEVRVFSRSAERRERFAERMADILRVPVTARATPQDVVAGADIVLVATNTGPTGVIACQGAWLEPGQHVVSIGSTTPVLREIDPECFLRADFVAFDADAEQIRRESGDVAAVCANAPAWRAHASLVELATGAIKARTAPDQITLFKSVGTAGQDLLGALHVYRAALDLGVGTDVSDIALPKKF